MGILPHKFRNFWVWGTIWTNGASHRPAMAMGVLAYPRGRQTTYSIRWWSISMVILAIWCRTLRNLPHKFRNFWVLGNYMHPRWQQQTSYGHRGCCTFKRTSNYIFYQVEELIQGVLGYLVHGFGNSPTQISKFFGLGEVYGQTVPDTDQLCTRGLVHI